jgi:hypothetical protein
MPYLLSDTQAYPNNHSLGLSFGDTSTMPMLEHLTKGLDQHVNELMFGWHEINTISFLSTQS